MNKQWIYRGLAIVGLIANILVIGTFGSGGSALEVEEWTQFVSTQGNYTIATPTGEGWEEAKEQNIHGTDFKLFTSHDSGVKLTAQTGEVGSIMGDLGKVGNVQKSAVRASHDFYVNLLSDLKEFTDEGSTTYDKLYGAEAYVTVFTYKGGGGLGGGMQKGITVTTASGTNTINFMATGKEADYDKLELIFDHFVMSFSTGTGGY